MSLPECPPSEARERLHDLISEVIDLMANDTHAAWEMVSLRILDMQHVACAVQRERAHPRQMPVAPDLFCVPNIHLGEKAV